ncbi:MAG: hypothetical protein WBD02_04905 [Acidimicrobiia bacterium]
MIGALRSEFVKMRSLRSTWYSIGAMAVLGVVGSALGGVPRGAYEQYNRLGFEYASQRVAVAVFAVMLVTGEFRNTAMVSSALAVPKRWTFHLAKTAVVALYGVLLAVVGFGSASLTMAARAGSFDVALLKEVVSKSSEYGYQRAATPPLFYVLLVVIGFAVFSGAIAFALRSQPAAIVVAAVGPLLSLFWQNQFNPFLSAEAAANPDQVSAGGHVIDRASGLAGFWIFVAVVVVISGVVHSRRDI